MLDCQSRGEARIRLAACPGGLPASERLRFSSLVASSRSFRYALEVCDVPGLPRHRHLEADLAHRLGKGRQVTVPADRIHEALDLLDAIHPQPTIEWGMALVWFRGESDFRILDPHDKTGFAWPTDTAIRGSRVRMDIPLGTSRLGLILNNKAKLGVNLCIPDAGDRLLERAGPWIQSHLSPKMSPTQWRFWTPTLFGSFNSHRLAAPGLAALILASRWLGHVGVKCACPEIGLDTVHPSRECPSRLPEITRYNRHTRVITSRGEHPGAKTIEACLGQAMVGVV